MSDTQLVSQAIRGETRWVLNMDAYKRQTQAKGAVTPAQMREVAGLSRSTEHRWKHGITTPDWDKAREVASNLELDVSELIVEVAA